MGNRREFLLASAGAVALIADKGAAAAPPAWPRYVRAVRKPHIVGNQRSANTSINLIRVDGGSAKILFYSSGADETLYSAFGLDRHNPDTAPTHVVVLHSDRDDWGALGCLSTDFKSTKFLMTSATAIDLLEMEDLTAFRTGSTPWTREAVLAATILEPGVKHRFGDVTLTLWDDNRARDNNVNCSVCLVQHTTELSVMLTNDLFWQTDVDIPDQRILADDADWPGALDRMLNGRFDEFKGDESTQSKRMAYAKSVFDQIVTRAKPDFLVPMHGYAFHAKRLDDARSHFFSPKQ